MIDDDDAASETSYKSNVPKAMVNIPTQFYNEYLCLATGSGG
jgi:hypothetical protein